jgi:hypothetical protein
MKHISLNSNTVYPVKRCELKNSFLAYYKYGVKMSRRCGAKRSKEEKKKEEKEKQ